MQTTRVIEGNLLHSKSISLTVQKTVLQKHPGESLWLLWSGQPDSTRQIQTWSTRRSRHVRSFRKMETSFHSCASFEQRSKGVYITSRKSHVTVALRAIEIHTKGEPGGSIPSPPPWRCGVPFHVGHSKPRMRGHTDFFHHPLWFRKEIVPQELFLPAGGNVLEDSGNL